VTASAHEHDVDPRFSLANERTYLAWIRTALAMIVAGVVAAKALEFHHEAARWAIAAPPIAAGALLAVEGHRRWRTYEVAMRRAQPLSTGHHLGSLAIAVAGYALIALLVTVLDG
jgi:putative membrane protein